MLNTVMLNTAIRNTPTTNKANMTAEMMFNWSGNGDIIQQAASHLYSHDYAPITHKLLYDAYTAINDLRYDHISTKQDIQELQHILDHLNDVSMIMYGMHCDEITCDALYTDMHICP